MGQFRRFVEATEYDAGDRCWTYENDDMEERSGHDWSSPGYAQSDDHPVVCVSWEDVLAYASWLSSETGVLHRLPTEAEWEYACRAGTTTRWSFGDDESQLTHYAWYRDNAWDVGERYAHAVGRKLPNAWGLHDMHGNVWEWVQDWYDDEYYNSSPRVDPLGPTPAPIASLGAAASSMPPGVCGRRCATTSRPTSASSLVCAFSGIR